MATITEVLVMQDKFSASFGKYIKLAEQGTASTREMNDAIKKVTQDASMLATTNRLAAAQSEAVAAAARAQAAQTAALAAQERLEAQRARAAARAANEQARAHEKEAQAANGLVDKIKGLVGAYAGLQGLKTLVNMSDEMTQINGRLQLMTGSAEAAAAAQEKIFQAAQRSRGAYTDLAGLVSQLGMMAPDTFGSTDELIAFAEQLQKQMAISGASGASAAAAMTQLTQALASGTLRGDELNSVLEQTPMIAKTIADYMGLTTGQLRDVAAEGQVTADIVKNAMLSAADETNAAFESMPMTWSQVWTMMQNTALDALQPVLDGISWVANHMDQIGPAAAGAAAGLTVFATASYAASGGVEALAAALSAINPVFVLVGALVGVAVYAITNFVQSAGSLQIAWLTAVDAVLTGLGNMKVKFVYGISTLQDSLDQLSIGAQSVAYGVADYFGDMKVNALTSIQGLANGAVDAINWLINQVNKIPGVAIDTVDKLTFAANAATENEAAKAARASTLASLKADAAARTAQRQADYNNLKNQVYNDHMQRMVGIYNAKAELASGTTFGQGTGIGEIPGMSDLTGAVNGVGKDVSSIKKEVSLSDENLKELVDVATGKYVNQINLTSQTPVITVNGQNTGKTKEDRQALADALKMVLAEQLAAGAAGAMALPI